MHGQRSLTTYGSPPMLGSMPQLRPAPSSFLETGGMGMSRPSSYGPQSPYLDSGSYSYPGSFSYKGAAPVPMHSAPPVYAKAQVPTPAPAMARKPECQDNFAEEECLDGQECGNDATEPRAEHLLLGFDTRPLLPFALAASTVLGGASMLLLQVPLASRLVGCSEASLAAPLCPVYVLTLGCMAYAAVCDPGQMRVDAGGPQSQALVVGDSFSSQGTELELPKRAHRSWQYERPIRRYDHYCRWLTNVIGLLNHREFFVMLAGLVAIALAGVVVDVTLLCIIARDGFAVDEVLVVLHLGYSAALLALAGPILKIHAGLISRNELANEWRRNDFYIVVREQGEQVAVNDLSDEEFNELFEQFKYDESRNPWSNGWLRNCLAFWTTRRWHPDELGEF